MDKQPQDTIQIGDELTILDWRTNTTFRAWAISSVQIDPDDKIPTVAFVSAKGFFHYAYLSDDGRTWIDGDI